ncbi:hypothetical protein C8F04DRAFT_1189243 [Mycena alexandri]|uniref:Uncharacterized protein n=1 Tax=Mycena alexandri TaxID=1745969 RepID=A0AAD6SK90_9AGAR|nr:hypothetical protein C8F04DRAFT_1189243 [Mycena alexandri]
MSRRVILISSAKALDAVKMRPAQGLRGGTRLGTPDEDGDNAPHPRFHLPRARASRSYTQGRGSGASPYTYTCRAASPVCHYTATAPLHWVMRLVRTPAARIVARRTPSTTLHPARRRVPIPLRITFPPVSQRADLARTATRMSLVTLHANAGEEIPDTAAGRAIASPPHHRVLSTPERRERDSSTPPCRRSLPALESRLD